MKHIGTFLLILLFVHLLDILNPKKSFIRQTDPSCAGDWTDWTVPSGAAILIFVIFEAFYWIIFIFFHNH